MKVEEIKHWRQCDLLKDFFDIRCASTALNETSVGAVIDFLLTALAESEKKREEAEFFIKGLNGAINDQRTARDQVRDEIIDKTWDGYQAALSTLRARVAQLEVALKEIIGKSTMDDAPLRSIAKRALTSSPSALAEVLEAAKELETTVKTFLHDLDEHDSDETLPKILMSNGMWMQVAALRKLVGK